MSAELKLIEGVRTCKKCGCEKPLSDFYSTTARNGSKCLRHSCKKCVNLNRVQRHEYRKKEWKQIVGGDPRRYMLLCARTNAYTKGVPCTLTVEDIFIPSHCPILGIELGPVGAQQGKRPDNMPTLDRLIPALGYIPGNVSVISMRANRIKDAGTVQEHEAIAAWMRSRGAR